LILICSVYAFLTLVLCMCTTVVSLPVIAAAASSAVPETEVETPQHPNARYPLLGPGSVEARRIGEEMLAQIGNACYYPFYGFIKITYCIL
jgi:hypothetical protein